MRHRMQLLCPLICSLIAISAHANTQKVTTANFNQVKTKLWQQYVKDAQSFKALKFEFDNRALKFGDKTMRFSLEKRGEEPAEGYPLYIALHGGGSAPSSLNDSQWEAMKYYYNGSVNNGIYVATRGVTDNWKLHFEDESYPLYDKLIEAAILFEHVDPNRVYIMGFSAGGDGVYQITPRMASRFAAANMSAGHHNWITFDNLYNTPFLIQVGELDSMYKRNQVAAENNIALNELQQTYGSGFVHDIYIHYKGSHNSWRDNDASRRQQVVIANPVAWLKGDRSTKTVNSNAIDWLNQYTRQPVPTKLVWDLNVGAPSRTYQAGSEWNGQHEMNLASPSSLYYWLDVHFSGEYPKDGKVVAALDKATNTVKFSELKNIKSIGILLNPSSLNLDAPVTVMVGDEKIGTVDVKQNVEIMRRTMLERSDNSQIYDAEIILTPAVGAKHWKISA